VAKEYRVGRPIAKTKRVVIPVTYKRTGRFCADFEFERKAKTETVSYQLVRQGGSWKIAGRQPDYPYISESTLRKWLSKTSSDQTETPERKQQALQAIKALGTAGGHR
jgi:hypothetical protein